MQKFKFSIVHLVNLQLKDVLSSWILTNEVSWIGAVTATFFRTTSKTFFLHFHIFWLCISLNQSSLMQKIKLRIYSIKFFNQGRSECVCQMSQVSRVPKYLTPSFIFQPELYFALLCKKFARFEDNCHEDGKRFD